MSHGDERGRERTLIGCAVHRIYIYIYVCVCVEGESVRDSKNTGGAVFFTGRRFREQRHSNAPRC